MADRPATAIESTGLYRAERTIAIILGIAAIGHVALGLLRGFAIVEWRPASAGTVAPDFAAGMLWMLPAIAASILAAVLAHAGRHGPMRAGAEAGTMRAAAYVAGLATVVLGALTLLVGYDLIGMSTMALDGLLWGAAAIVGALITWGFYAAVPSALEDEDYLVELVETRVRAGGPAPQARARPAAEME